MAPTAPHDDVQCLTGSQGKLAGRLAAESADVEKPGATLRAVRDDLKTPLTGAVKVPFIVKTAACASPLATTIASIDAPASSARLFIASSRTDGIVVGGLIAT